MTHKLLVIKNDETKDLDQFADQKYEVKRLELIKSGSDVYAYVLLEFDDF